MRSGHQSVGLTDQPGDRWPFGVQRNPQFSDIDPGFRIGCRSGSKSFKEARLEVLHGFEPATELVMDGWPGYRRCLTQLVTAPS